MRKDTRGGAHIPEHRKHAPSEAARDGITTRRRHQGDGRKREGANRTALTVGYLTLVLAGMAYVIGPSNLAWSNGYMIGPSFGHSIGDHVQITYYLWLWWHSLTTLSHLPWVDPFQFALISDTLYQATGWPLVLLSIPVQAVAGPVAAFNAVFIGAYLAAAGTTFLLARELGASRPGAAVAGFAFAFAPFRLMQSGHMNSLLAFLIPLTLLMAEKAIRREGREATWAAWACTASYLSLVASGEMHLILYVTILLAAYGAVRAVGVPLSQLTHLILPGVVLVTGASLILGFVNKVMLAPSVRGAYKGAEEAHLYAPRVGDLFTRQPTMGAERYAYPGTAIFALAILGGIVAWLRLRLRLLVVFFAAVVVASIVFAVTPSMINHPQALRLHRLIPFLSNSRVPGRVLLLSALVLAVLAGIGIDFVRNRRWRYAFAAIAVAVILIDLPTRGTFRYTTAGGEPLARVPRGAPLLNLPPFPPDHFAPSRYMQHLTQNPGPRVGGYYVLVTPEIEEAQRSTHDLTNVPPDPCHWTEAVETFGFEYVAVHFDLFGDAKHHQWPVDPWNLIKAFNAMDGFERVSLIDHVAVYRVKAEELACPRP